MAKPPDDRSKDYGYGHHCKQYKKIQVLAECKYDSSAMGNQTPISYQVSDLDIYNSKSH